MDCRSFKEYLDSYFCEELAVETNHAMLRHAELCPPCRDEMAARRELRVKLRRACLREAMGAEARHRLRARLRDEAHALCPAARAKRRAGLGDVGGWFTFRLAAPAFAAILVVLGAVAWLALVYFRSVSPPQVSAALLEQAVEDHKSCAPKYRDGAEAGALTAEVDPAYQGLERIASQGAAGMRLCSAHVCGFAGRAFAHLVYRDDARLVSLLVTARDDGAVADARASQRDVKTALTAARQENWSLGICQTPRHVVMVVSDLPAGENKLLAERMALPVAEYLRGRERSDGAAAARAGRLTGAGWNQAIANVEKEETHR